MSTARNNNKKTTSPRTESKKASTSARPSSALQKAKEEIDAATRTPKTKSIEDIPRKKNGQFEKGYSPRKHGVNPEKNRNVSGRRRILMVFDRVIGEERHLGKLETEIRREISNVGMLEFYRQYILPLLPKEMVVSALNLNLADEDGNSLDPSTPEGKEKRDQALREIFGLDKLEAEQAQYEENNKDVVDD